MPTAGTPPRVSPNNVRNSGKLCQVGAAADSKTISEEDDNDAVMMALRPQASDIGPASSMLTANTALLSVRDSALSAALTSNCRLNSSINGCTQYSKPKVATPAANIPKLVRRKAGVP
jgi:hypothetical protein